jgi:flagellar protein FlaG
MGMQLTSLSLGHVAAHQELPQEKRPPLPIEQKAAARQAEVTLLGSGKTQTQELKQTASDLEQISLAFNRRLKFEIDQESREILIKIIDNETDKVIKVLPPEELQRLHSRIRETLGFLFDRMV